MVTPVFPSVDLDDLRHGSEIVGEAGRRIVQIDEEEAAPLFQPHRQQTEVGRIEAFGAGHAGSADQRLV